MTLWLWCFFVHSHSMCHKISNLIKTLSFVAWARAHVIHFAAPEWCGSTEATRPPRLLPRAPIVFTWLCLFCLFWYQCQHLPQDQAKLLDLLLVAKSAKLATLISSSFFLFLFKASYVILRLIENALYWSLTRWMSSDFRVEVQAIQLPCKVNMLCEAERGRKNHI